MNTLKQLSTKIYNVFKDAVKAYCKRVRDLQDEVIKFNEEMKQYLGDKK